MTRFAPSAIRFRSTSVNSKRTIIAPPLFVSGRMTMGAYSGWSRAMTRSDGWESSLKTGEIEFMASPSMMVRYIAEETRIWEELQKLDREHTRVSMHPQETLA